MVEIIVGRRVIRDVLSLTNARESIRMTRLSVSVVIAFVVGCITASAISGCTKAADRTLTIYQLQSTKTYDGQFRLDTSQLPSDAIKESIDTGGPGEPLKRITLTTDYEFEIVLRLAGVQPANGGSTSHSSPN